MSTHLTRLRAIAFVGLLVTVDHFETPVAEASGPPYKNRHLVDVLREFQRQGVRIIFSTGLVRPEMRVVAEPAGDDPHDIITAILTPHRLALEAGLRGILLVVHRESN